MVSALIMPEADRFQTVVMAISGFSQPGSGGTLCEAGQDR